MLEGGIMRMGMKRFMSLLLTACLLTGLLPAYSLAEAVTTPTDLNKVPEIVSLAGAPSHLEVDYGTPEAELGLPGSLTATYDNGESAGVSATWVCVSDGGYDQEPDDPTKVYSFEPVLEAGAVCSADLALPKVSVSLVLPLMTLAEPATAAITNTRGTLSYTVDGLPEGVTVASQQWMNGDAVVGTEAAYVLTMDDMKARATISLSLKDSDGNVLCTDDYDIDQENGQWIFDPDDSTLEFREPYNGATTNFPISGTFFRINIYEAVSNETLIAGEGGINVSSNVTNCKLSSANGDVFFIGGNHTISGGSITAASLTVNDGCTVADAAIHVADSNINVIGSGTIKLNITVNGENKEVTYTADQSLISLLDSLDPRGDGEVWMQNGTVIDDSANLAVSMQGANFVSKVPPTLTVQYGGTTLSANEENFLTTGGTLSASAMNCEPSSYTWYGMVAENQFTAIGSTDTYKIPTFIEVASLGRIPAAQYAGILFCAATLADGSTVTSPYYAIDIKPDQQPKLISSTEGKYTVNTVLSFDKDTEYFKNTYGLTTYDTGKGCYYWGPEKAQYPDSSSATYTLTPADLQGEEHTITGWMYLYNEITRQFRAYPATYTIPANTEWTLDENGTLTFIGYYDAGTTRFPVDGLTYSDVNTNNRTVIVDATVNGKKVKLDYGDSLRLALDDAAGIGEDVGEYSWFRLTADGPIKLSGYNTDTVTFATHNQTFVNINGYPDISMTGLNRTSYIGDTVTITTRGMPDGFKVQLVYSYNDEEYASFDLNPTAPGSNSYSFTLPVKTFDDKPLSGTFTVKALAVGGESQVLAETRMNCTIVPRITITKDGIEGVYVAGDKLSVPDAAAMMSNYCLSVSSVLPYSWNCSSLSYGLDINTPSYSLTNADLGNMDGQTNIVYCHIVLKNDSTAEEFSVDPTFELPQNNLWDYSENDGFTLIGDYDGSASHAYPLPNTNNVKINVDTGKSLYNFHLDNAIVNNDGTIYDTTFTNCSVKSNTGAIHVPVTIDGTTYTSTPSSDVKFLYGENTLATLNAWYENLHGEGSSKDLVWVDTSTKKEVSDSDTLALSDNSFILFGRMQVTIDAPTGYFVGSKLYANVKLETSLENVRLDYVWVANGEHPGLTFVPDVAIDSDDTPITLMVTATSGEYSVTCTATVNQIVKPYYTVTIAYENEEFTIASSDEFPVTHVFVSGSKIDAVNNRCVVPLNTYNNSKFDIGLSVYNGEYDYGRGVGQLFFTRTPIPDDISADFSIVSDANGDPRNVTITCAAPGKYKEIRVAGTVYSMTDSGIIVASVPAGADVTVEARLRGNDAARLLPSWWGAVGTISASEWPYLHVTEDNLLSDSSSLFWGETLTVETNAELTWAINGKVVEDPSTVTGGVRTYLVPADVNTLTITATKDGQTVIYETTAKCPITVTLNYAEEKCTVTLDDKVTSKCTINIFNEKFNENQATTLDPRYPEDSSNTLPLSRLEPDIKSYLPFTLQFKMDEPTSLPLLSVALERFDRTKVHVMAELEELYGKYDHWCATYSLSATGDGNTYKFPESELRDKDNQPCAADQLVAGQTYTLFARMYSVDEYGMQNSFVSDWFDTGLTVTPGISLDSYTPVVGQTITATSAQTSKVYDSAWNWHRLTKTTDSPISDATSNTYTVTMADVGCTLRAVHLIYGISNGLPISKGSALVETTAAVPQPTIKLTDDRGNVLVKNEDTGSYLVEPGTTVTAKMTNYVGDVSWTWSDGTSDTDSFTLSYAHPSVTLSNNLTDETVQIQILLPSPGLRLDYVNETLELEMDDSLPNFDEVAKEGAEIALQIVEILDETTNTVKTLPVTTGSDPFIIPLSTLDASWPDNNAHNLLFKWQVKPTAAGTPQDIHNTSALTIPARPAVTQAEMAAALTHVATPYSITYTGDAAHEMRIKTVDGTVITGDALQNLTYSTTYQLEGRLLASNGETDPHFASEWVYACDETTLARYSVTPVFNAITYTPGMSLVEDDLLQELYFYNGSNWPCEYGSVSLSLSEGSFPITNVGTYKVKLTTTPVFDKEYELTDTECELTISCYDLFNHRLYIRDDKMTYTGSPLTPSFYFYYTPDGSDTSIEVDLTSSDYEIEWIHDSSDAVVSAMQNAGQYVLSLKGKGNYTGSTFDYPYVYPRDITDCVVALLSTLYDGTAKTLTVSVDGRTLTKDTDYTVAFTRDNQPVTEIKEAGDYTVTLNGIGNYTNTYETTVTVSPISIMGSTVTFAKTGTTTAVYSASEKAIKVTLDGKELVSNQDYTLTVTRNAAPAALHYAGSYGVTVTGTGNYADSLTKTLIIRPYEVKLTGATLRDKYYGEGTDGYSGMKDVLVDGYTLSNGLFPADADDVTLTCFAQLTGTGTGKDKPVQVWLNFGADNWELAGSYATNVITGTINVKPLELSLTLTDPLTLTYTGETSYAIPGAKCDIITNVPVLEAVSNELADQLVVNTEKAIATLQSGTGVIGALNAVTLSGVQVNNAAIAAGNAVAGTGTGSIMLTARTLDGAQVTLTPGVYNGAPQQLTLTLPDGTVLTGDQLVLPADADMTNAGTRTLEIASSVYAYTGATLTAAVTIAPATPTIVWPSAGDITYGDALSDSILTSTDANGTFAWKFPEHTPDAGERLCTVVYTPADTVNYNYRGVTLEKKIPVQVNKAATVIDVSGVKTAYTYTGKLQTVNTGAKLNHRETKPTYTNNTFTTVQDGNGLTVTITAQETANYLPAKASVTLSVAAAKAPAIEWPTAGKLTYGQMLSESKLKGGSTGLGAFTWQEDATMKEIGVQAFTLVFIPADTENYLWDDARLTQSVKVHVEKRPVAIRANGRTKVYGESDPALTATVEGLLEGDTIAYTLTRDPGETAGSYTIRVRASDTDIYTVTTARGTLTIRAKDVTDLTADALPTLLYTGRAVKPEPVIRDAEGNVLKQGRDYTLTYTDNREPGTGTVIVNGKGNYTGTLELTFPVVDPKESEALKALLYGEAGEGSAPPTLVYSEAGVPMDYGLLDVTGRQPGQTEIVRMLLTEDTTGEREPHVLSMPASQLASLSERGVRLLAFTHLNATVLVPTEALLSGNAAKLAALVLEQNPRLSDPALDLAAEPDANLTVEQLNALRYEIRIAPVEGSDAVEISVWLCWSDGRLELTPYLSGLMTGLALTGEEANTEDWQLVTLNEDGTEAALAYQQLVIPDDLLETAESIGWYSVTIHADGIEEVHARTDMTPESCRRTLLCAAQTAPGRYLLRQQETDGE